MDMSKLKGIGRTLGVVVLKKFRLWRNEKHDVRIWSRIWNDGYRRAWLGFCELFVPVACHRDYSPGIFVGYKAVEGNKKGKINVIKM